MAKLNLTVDTETHEMTAEINGTPVTLNVQNVSVYNFGSDGRPQWTFSLCTRDAIDDVVVRTTVEASLAPAGSAPSPLAPDLRVAPADGTPGEALAEWYGGLRCR